jgi:hypothetical protein
MFFLERASKFGIVLGMVEQTCNPNIQATEAGGSPVQASQAI